MVAAGEGIVTKPSLRTVLPRLSMIAGLSANQLARSDALHVTCDDDRMAGGPCQFALRYTPAGVLRPNEAVCAASPELPRAKMLWPPSVRQGFFSFAHKAWPLVWAMISATLLLSRCRTREPRGL